MFGRGLSVASNFLNFLSTWRIFAGSGERNAIARGQPGHARGNGAAPLYHVRVAAGEGVFLDPLHQFFERLFFEVRNIGGHSGLW